MKYRKLTALLLAAAAAITPVSAAAAQIPLSASAADGSAGAELPDWIPNDYYSAVEFYNSFGGSLIGDGLVCLVFAEEFETVPEGEPQGILRYALSATKGIAQCLRDEIYRVDGSSLGLRVAVYQPQRQGTLSVTHTDTWLNAREEGEPGTRTYSFWIEETDPTYHTLSVKEIGLSSWLPDCYAEYDRYVKEHGQVSVHENYVVFCMSAGIGTAYEWREKATDYKKNFEYRTTRSCNTVSGTPVAGGTSYTVVVYQAVEDGHAAIEWEYGSFLTDGKVSKTLTADCMVTDGTQNILLPHMMRIEFRDANYDARANIPSMLNPVTLAPSAMMVSIGEGQDIYTALDIAPVTADCNPFIWNCVGLDGCKVDIDVSETALPKDFHLADGDYKQVTEYPNGAHNVEFYVRYGEPVEGDLNGDGVFGIADAVLLSQWLLGLSDAWLSDWRAADFAKDGKLNAADLTLMKRALLRKNQTEEPLIAIDRENTWIDYQQTDLYTSAMLSDIPEAIDLIETIKTKTYALSYTDTISWEYRIMDFGAETLYLPLKDQAGNDRSLQLSESITFGSGNSVLDDPDVLALVRLLSEKVIFGVQGGFDFDEAAARSVPVAITLQQNGGFAGVRNLWRIFRKDGVCTVSYTDQKHADVQQKVAVIGENEFHDFMAQDFTPYYNQFDPASLYSDAFYYYTVFTYEDGFTRATRSNTTDIQYALMDLIDGTPLNN